MRTVEKLLVRFLRDVKGRNNIQGASTLCTDTAERRDWVPRAPVWEPSHIRCGRNLGYFTLSVTLKISLFLSLSFNTCKLKIKAYTLHASLE